MNGAVKKVTHLDEILGGLNPEKASQRHAVSFLPIGSSLD
jgi:hypothetical protein